MHLVILQKLHDINDFDIFLSRLSMSVCSSGISEFYKAMLSLSKYSTFPWVLGKIRYINCIPDYFPFA